jgi:hypothetical protein
MGLLIQYVANAAPFIYAICGFVALLQLYRTWQTRAERRQAIFSLEREKALNDLYNIFMTAMALLLVMGVTYFVSTTLARAVAPVIQETLDPQMQAVALIPTPTNTPLPTTPTATPDVAAVSASDASALTPTPAAQPQGNREATPVVVEAVPTPMPEPPPPPVAPALCPDGRSAIISPGNGAVVSGRVDIVGTAQHDQFNYYKLEYAPGSNAGEGYGYLDGGQSQVVGGLLGSLNTTNLGNGVYTIQLVVVDTTGNYPPPCRVTLTVRN